MTYAEVADVSASLGRPITSDSEVAQVTSWLEGIEARIVARFKRAGLVLADQILLDDPSLETVVRVEVDAVIRRMYQPLPGRTSTTRSVDDAAITERWEHSTQAITDEEWNDLLPGSGSGAFSTRPGFEVDRTPWVWPWT